MVAIVSVLLAATGICLIIVANVISERLVNEVNSASSVGDRISPLFLQTKMGTLLTRHRTLFPESPLRRRMYFFGITGVSLVLLSGFVGALLG